MPKKNMLDFFTKPLIPTITQTVFFTVFLAFILSVITGLLPAPLNNLFAVINIELAIPVFLGLFVSLYILNVLEQVNLIKNWVTDKAKKKDLISIAVFSVVKALIFSVVILNFIMPFLTGILGQFIEVQAIMVSMASMTVLASTIMSFVLTFFVWENVKHIGPVKQFAVAKA